MRITPGSEGLCRSIHQISPWRRPLRTLTFFCCRSQAGSSTASRSHSSSGAMYPSTELPLRFWEILPDKPLCPLVSWWVVVIANASLLSGVRVRWWLINADVQRIEHLKKRKKPVEMTKFTHVSFYSLFFSSVRGVFHALTHTIYSFDAYVPVLWNKIPDIINRQYDAREKKKKDR